jgi:hypothetical protein
MNLEDCSFTKNFEENKEEYFRLLEVIRITAMNFFESRHFDLSQISEKKEEFDKLLHDSLKTALLGLEPFKEKLDEYNYWMQPQRESVAGHQATYVIRRAYNEGLL